MKRSVLALLLSVAIGFACTAVTVYGYETTVLPNTVTVYTPQEAQEALEDKSFQGTVSIGADFDLTEGTYGVNVPGFERTVTLDLNGHTVSCADSISNNAFLRIIDSVGTGQLLFRYDTGSLRNIGGTVVLEKIKVVYLGERRYPDRRVESPLIRNTYSGKLIISESELISNGSEPVINNQGATCVINSGVMRGKNIISSEHGTELYPFYSYDENGEEIGSTGAKWVGSTLIINGGRIEGEECVIETVDTDVTITGGVIRGWVRIMRYAEHEDGRPIWEDGKLIWLEMQYYNTAGDAVTLPKPTYELHEDNGVMKRGYQDVSTDDWFYAPVQTLMDNGVLDYGEGRDKGSFGPAEPLTRGQAAALLLRACGAEVAEETDEPPFLDVTAQTLYAKYINAGQRLGLLSGDGQKRFHPEDTITRQEFAVLVMNAVHKNGLEFPSERRSVSFRDADSIASWAKDAVAEGASYGLWNGTGNGDFLPQSPITRAEGVTILARLMEHMDI